jgi:hypothetical protein
VLLHPKETIPASARTAGSRLIRMVDSRGLGWG